MNVPLTFFAGKQNKRLMPSSLMDFQRVTKHRTHSSWVRGLACRVERNLKPFGHFNSRGTMSAHCVVVDSMIAVACFELDTLGDIQIPLIRDRRPWGCRMTGQ